MRTLVSLVVERGLASFIEVEAALKKQGVYGGDLVSYLLEHHSDHEGELTTLLAETLDIPACNPTLLAPPRSAAFSRVPATIAKKYLALPFAFAGGVLSIAVSDVPTDAVQSELRAASGCSLRFFAAPVVRIWQGLMVAYKLAPPSNWKRVIDSLPIGSQKMIVVSEPPPPASVPPSSAPSAAPPTSQPRATTNSARPAPATSQNPPPLPSERSLRPAPLASQSPPPLPSERSIRLPPPPSRPPTHSAPPVPSPEVAGPSDPEVVMSELSDFSDADIEDILHASNIDSELVVSGPRTLPRPHQNSESDLPKIMIADDPENARLVEAALRGGDSGAIAIGRLREIGVPALFAIMDRFPGPTVCDRTTMLSKLPGPSSVGPLVSLVHSMGRLALQDLLARTNDPIPETRFWSLYLVSFMLETSMVPTLLPRLLDTDVSVRKMAHKLTHILVQHRPTAIAQFVDPLIAVIRDHRVDMPQRIRATTTLGDLRATKAVAALIEVTRYPERELAVEANDALIAITCHDPIASGMTWPSWYASYGKMHRLEWLIDALLGEQLKLRESAFTELRARTGVFFGFHPNMSKVEREHIYRRYLEWWRHEGAEKFTGSTL